TKPSRPFAEDSPPDHDQPRRREPSSDGGFPMSTPGTPTPTLGGMNHGQRFTPQRPKALGLPQHHHQRHNP
ncbi:hypothetical protein, partial [Rhizocola hellebori]|uniref:hypothetical protein n=1 Tax=Rhizocola hellebori TaxID=1392758 RepID=UPI001942D48B